MTFNWAVIVALALSVVACGLEPGASNAGDAATSTPAPRQLTCTRGAGRRNYANIRQRLQEVTLKCSKEMARLHTCGIWMRIRSILQTTGCNRHALPYSRYEDP